jgi:hypothetical protein
MSNKLNYQYFSNSFNNIFNFALGNFTYSKLGNFAYLISGKTKLSFRKNYIYPLPQSSLHYI